MSRALAIAAAVALPLAAAAAEKPHIVYLLADDLGWADVSFHDGQTRGTIRTPNIDKLAATGVRLEQFYVQPVCSPTRAVLLTGRYPIRQGLQVGVVRPWADYGLPLEERTLAQALNEAGYFTAICGKWHLGHFERAYLPTRRGFDHQYGHYNGALDYFTHQRDGGHDWHRNDKACHDEGYTTLLLGKEATSLIEKHDPATPLFLYVPFNAPHTPLQAPEKYLEPYADINQKRRRIYAGMVSCMDEVVGNIVAALERKGMRKDTLIIFHSDNGGPVKQGADNGPLRGAKGTLYEGGVRVPMVMNWPGVLKPGSVVNTPVHVTDMYPTLITLAGGSLEQKLPPDGVNVWPAVAEGKPSPRREILHNLTPNGGAIRKGDWKLVVGGKRTELFNIAKDPYEKRNLAEEHPEKVKELQQRLDAYAKEAVAPKSKPKAEDFKVPKVWGEPE